VNDIGEASSEGFLIEQPGLILAVLYTVAV